MRVHELFEGYERYSDEELIKMFADAMHPALAKRIRAELVKRGHREYNDDIQFEEIDQDIDEAMAWAKSGNKVVRKFRCTGGPRHGRVVSKPGQCFAPPDMKKRIKLKQTKARMGKKMTRKAKKTKRTSAVSKRVKALNK